MEISPYNMSCLGPFGINFAWRRQLNKIFLISLHFRIIKAKIKVNVQIVWPANVFLVQFGPVRYPFFKCDLLQISKEVPKQDLHMLNKWSTK